MKEWKAKSRVELTRIADEQEAKHARNSVIIGAIFGVTLFIFLTLMKGWI